MEPEGFVDTSISRGIAAFARDPQGALSVREPYVFILVCVSNLD